MTSWLRTPGTVPPCLLLCCVVVAVYAKASSAGDSVCSSPRVTSCSQCLRRPQCAWCFMETFHDGLWPGHRCDLPVNLLRRGCPSEYVEQTEVKVENNETISSTQVTPQDISITLRPGAGASVVVAVKQLERYPVDLYYLVDVSASMQEHLDQLKTAGIALSLRMLEHSTDFRMGFGSFVDKPVSPFINVHPSKISNPCSDFEVNCRPAHGFHHVLRMTGNMSEFTRVIKNQRISGNMDTPEGGLDAMLQTAVCQGEVGWRPEAKRLLLLMTDQPSHLALDSRLAGIVTPNDGECHLENNIYTGSTKMDHPSVALLSEKLLQNHIYSIFAIEKQQHQWYQELVRLIPGSYLGKLGLFQGPNLSELVVEAYKRLLSEVGLSVSVEDKAASRYWVSVSPLCPNGSTAEDQSCTGVQPNQTVHFNVTIGLRSCPEDGENQDVRVTVRPIGYNETTVIRIHTRCSCSCGPTRRCWDKNQSLCTGTQDDSRLEQRQEHGPIRAWATWSKQTCRAEGSDVDCSGRGECDCGRCVCEQSKLGTVYGRYCEKDDFSCPYERGHVCGGRGACVSGECVCEDGWTGETCNCPLSQADCQSADGLLCSGLGKCVCGKCVCEDVGHSGDVCERCPSCQSTCQSHWYWQCVSCHLARGFSLKEAGVCNNSCPPQVIYRDYLSGQDIGTWIQCMFISNDSCRYSFQIGSRSGQTEVHISRRSECRSSSRLIGTFLSVCALTVLCGLVVVAMSRLILQKKRWAAEATTEVGLYRCTGKDLAYIPTTNEKTVTYRRDQPPDPEEMHTHIPKMPLGDPWHY